MSVRLGTFNIENLMTRFDFSGFRNQLKQDRVLRLFSAEHESDYQRLEEARTVSLTDDTRQMSALVIADLDADILCLQEVESLETLDAFEFGYLYRMMGEGYRQKYLIEGNDGRGIDVAVMMRERTRSGLPIEFVDIRSHAAVTFRQMQLLELATAAGENPDDKIFRRDCLELDLKVGGKPLTLFVVHLKSMTTPRDGMDGRTATMALRKAEVLTVRAIVEQRFGAAHAQASFAICGDMNDYYERLIISGDRRTGYSFEPFQETESALYELRRDNFAVNVMERRPVMDRWTLYHSRGLSEQHLCQLDYIWLSPRLAEFNANRVPEIIRAGQPFRTPFPEGQATERYPRTGWDRPKASDHCAIAIELDLP